MNSVKRNVLLVFVFDFDILELVRFSGGGDLLCFNRVEVYITTTLFDYFFDVRITMQMKRNGMWYK